MNNIWLHRYSILLAVCTLLLVVAGASVTSNDAGLSVPDWPLSFGKVMPEMKGGVFYEHGHRMVATTVGLLTIGLVIWIWSVDQRRWLKRLSLAALGAVVVQGVLGGMTVLYKLPPAISVSHACLAQLFFSTTVAIALFTSPYWKRGAQEVPDSGWPSLRSLVVVAAAVVLGQLALGAAYRHKALDITPHIIGALVVLAVVTTVAVITITQHSAHRGLKGAAKGLMHITFLQLVLGVAAYLTRINTSEGAGPSAALVVSTVIHVAVGALVMAASVVLAIQVFRNVRRPATGA